MNFHKIFEINPKVVEGHWLSVHFLNLFLMIALLSLLSQCGKKGVPPLGVIPVEEGAALSTMLTGAVQAVSVEGGADEFSILLTDLEGNILAQGETRKGKISLTAHLKKSQGPFFSVIAARKGDPTILEAAIAVEAGQTIETARPFEINPTTTLAAILGRALSQRGLEIAHEKILPIIQTEFSSFQVEAVLREISEKKIDQIQVDGKTVNVRTFKEGTDEFNQILRTILAHLRTVR